MAAENGFVRTACRIYHGRKKAWRWIQVESNLVRNKPEDPFIFNGILYDITERKEAELAAIEKNENLQRSLEDYSQRLVKANRKLRKEIDEKEEAREALLELASGVAHNFNNILMAVAGNTQAALGFLKNPQKAAKHLKNVLTSVDNGRDIVKRLMGNVLINNKDVLQTPPIEIAPVIKKTLNLIRSSWPGLAGDDIRLLVKVMNEDCRAVIRQGQLMEVLFNLLKNSLEAIQNKGVIKIGLVRKNQKAVIWVQDNGPGVSPGNEKKLFNPFFTTKGFLGQGLGLSISQKIITGFRGNINYVGKPGKGAFFTIELPLAEALNAPGKVSEPAPPARLQGLDILLIEDEALVALGMETFLTQSGCLVRHVTCIEKALAEIQKKLPQFVICDFGLPDGTACDVKKELIKLKCKAPVIFLTGWYKEQIITRPGYSACFPDALLQKPITNSELLGVIKKHLD